MKAFFQFERVFSSWLAQNKFIHSALNPRLGGRRVWNTFDAILLSYNKHWHLKCDFCDKQYKEIDQICVALHIQRAFGNNGDWFELEKCTNHQKQRIGWYLCLNQNQIFLSETKRIWMPVFGGKESFFQECTEKVVNCLPMQNHPGHTVN